MRTLKAGGFYFVLVFGAGFALGAVRVLYVVPIVGTRTAELIESPIMLVVTVLAARRAVRRFAIPPAPSRRIAVGLIALALLLLAEFTLVLSLRGLTIGEYFDSRDPVSGPVYLAMLGVLALMPLLVARKAAPTGDLPPSARGLADGVRGAATVLSIRPHNLHWLAGTPAQKDLCAHGGLLLTHEGQVLIDDADKNWALSAAALMLLRTLTSDHTPQSRVGDQLFPCCGHAMFVQPGRDEVWIPGCANGRDWQVLHGEGKVSLVFEGGRQVSVSQAEWRAAVLEFSEAVEGFYAGNARKQPFDAYDAAGFEAFRAEWARRRDAARPWRFPGPAPSRPGDRAARPGGIELGCREGGSL
ncbi:MAG TPA: hypothetical protein VFT43_06925 [Candidatus Polarisedimenticolia bacterium]|nr:hypothetical protein [Candidatus Polarisedimenticolia bacterium]